MFSHFQGRKAAIGIALLYIVFGILFIVFPGVIGSAFCWILAIGSLAIAAAQFWSFYRIRRDGGAGVGPLTLAVLLTIFGIFCIARADLILSFLPMVLGIVLLIDGIGKLPAAIGTLTSASGNLARILSGVSSLIPLILGIILIVDPFGAAKTVIVFFGISILVDGVLDLVSAINAIRAEKAEYKDIP